MENSTKIGAVLFVISLRVFYFAMRRHEKIVNDEKVKLKMIYSNQLVYLCEGREGVDEKLIMLWGEPYGGSIRSGMKIMAPDGFQYIIKEVYIDEKKTNKPSAEISHGKSHTAILVEAENWDDRSFSKKMKGKTVIALKVI